MSLHPFHHLTAKSELKSIDRVIAVAAVIYPLTGIPQVIELFWRHNAGGVSLVSWLGFAVFSAMFLIYALAHRLKPLIITQALWLVVDVLVVVGVIMYG